MGYEGVDAHHVDGGVELFGEEGEDGGYGTNEDGSPEGGEEFGAVLHDEDDEIVWLDTLFL